MLRWLMLGARALSGPDLPKLFSLHAMLAA